MSGDVLENLRAVLGAKEDAQDFYAEFDGFIVVVSQTASRPKDMDWVGLYSFLTKLMLAKGFYPSKLANQDELVW